MCGDFYEEIEIKLEDKHKVIFDANEYYSIKLVDDEGTEITISEKSLRKIIKKIDDFWKKVQESEEDD